MSEAQTPVEPVPPASRLGKIVGWSLLALAVACFIASGVAAKQADDWSQAMRQAHAAFTDAYYAHPDRVAAAYAAEGAAYAAQRKATLLKYLLVSATPIFLLLIPGLLYAMKPSLLGGPFGRLLRLGYPSLARLAQRQPRRHPVTFYQGIGFAFVSIGALVNSLLSALGYFFRGPFELLLCLSLLAVLLAMVSMMVGISLMREARWWFLSGKGATHEQERPQA